MEEAKQEVAELQQRDPKMGASVRVVEDKEELFKLKIPTAVGAVVQAIAAKLSPYKLVSWILEHMIKNSGLNLQTSTPVLSLSPLKNSASSPSWTIQTSRGAMSSRHVLLTTNGYTTYLLPQMKSLIVPVRGEMSALSTPQPLMLQALNHTYVFVGASGQGRIQDDYLVQRPVFSTANKGGELMFGGGRSYALYEGVMEDSDDTIDPPAAKYLRTTLPKILDLTGNAEDYYGSLFQGKELSAKKEWSGIMGFSRDGHPWVGAIPDAPGLWVSAAYTGSGKRLISDPLAHDFLLSTIILIRESGMPNTALSSHHTASLILAASKDCDWRDVEREAVLSGDIPACYIITKERIEIARKLPEIGDRSSLAGHIKI